MSTKTYISILILFHFQAVLSQNISKITGPLAVYDMIPGYTYNDSMGTDTISVQSQFKFGELGLTNQGVYFGVPFEAAVDSTLKWVPNKVFGIIQPPTEHGVYNQPADTSLLTPFGLYQGPGMVQGGQRFSRLSQLYSGFSGVILDDWNGDTSITRQVRDAVRGKPVDAAGNVNSDGVATTPYNKLITVLYSPDAVPDAMPVIDGVIYSLFHTQDTAYTTIDSQINVLVTNFPKKERTIAIFVNNSYLQWANPVSISYMLQHTLDRYDDGDINGITIFAGIYLTTEYISPGEWDSLSLTYWLDSLYFPYLGAGQGTVYDCSTASPLTGANLHVYCQGRLSGDTLSRSNQKADEHGHYQTGLWAGNRNTDSTYYWLIAEKTGYVTDTIGFWIRRGDTTLIPDISLCPGPDSHQQMLSVYPNPTQSWCNVVINDAGLFSEPVDVYDQLGRRIAEFPTSNGSGGIDMSGWIQGLYFVKVSGYVQKVIKE